MKNGERRKFEFTIQMVGGSQWLLATVCHVLQIDIDIGHSNIGLRVAAREIRRGNIRCGFLPLIGALSLSLCGNESRDAILIWGLALLGTIGKRLDAGQTCRSILSPA